MFEKTFFRILIKLLKINEQTLIFSNLVLHTDAMDCDDVMESWITGKHLSTSFFPQWSPCEGLGGDQMGVPTSI